MYQSVVYFFVLVLCGVVSSFPTDDGEVLVDVTNIKVFTMPEYCKNLEFCFNDTNYPIEIVEELLKDNDNLEVDQDEELGTGIANRLGLIDENDCRSKAVTDPIYYILDEADNVRVVVQMKDRFEQRFSVRWCDKVGALTAKPKHFLTSTAKQYNMYCENKYMKYDFLVLSLMPDIDGKYKLQRASTKSGVPVCCACKYNRI